MTAHPHTTNPPIVAADNQRGDVVVNFTVHRGKFTLEATTCFENRKITAIIGPNGAGKSTLLGAVAGFHHQINGFVRRGTIALTDTTVHPAVAVPPHKRKTVLLRQKAQLFPHMTVEQNIAFGPSSQGASRHDVNRIVIEWLERLHLSEFRKRYPEQLSGGQQQRVALARAFAARPETLLLDEPTAALDVDAARLFRTTLRDLMDQVPVTTLLVSHTIEDVVALADDILVLDGGTIVEHGPAATCLTHPRSAFLASFSGMNRISGTLSRTGNEAGDEAGDSFTAAGITLFCKNVGSDRRSDLRRGESTVSSDTGTPVTSDTGTPGFAAIAPRTVQISRTTQASQVLSDGQITEKASDPQTTQASSDVATKAPVNTWRTRVAKLDAQQSGFSVALERPAGLTAQVDLARFLEHPVRAGDEVTVYVAPDDVHAYPA